MSTSSLRQSGSNARDTQTFASDRSGSVTILFGLMALVMFLVVGVSIDMTRWLHARTQTIAAVDSAVLAGARQFRSTASTQMRRSRWRKATTRRMSSVARN